MTPRTEPPISPPEPAVVCECAGCQNELCVGDYAISYAGRVYCDSDCLIEALDLHDGTVETLVAGLQPGPDTTWERDNE